MSHLKYYSYEGVGVRNREIFGYSQAVRVGDRIECAGQGRWLRDLKSLDTIQKCIQC